MIRAHIKTDDEQQSVVCDCTPWFEQAEPDEIARLARSFWEGPHADSIAFFMHEEAQCKKAARIFKYLEQYKPIMRVGKIRSRAEKETQFVTFNVRVDSREALVWLRDRHQELWEVLRKETQELEDQEKREKLSRKGKEKLGATGWLSASLSPETPETLTLPSFTEDGEARESLSGS